LRKKDNLEIAVVFVGGGFTDILPERGNLNAVDGRSLVFYFEFCGHTTVTSSHQKYGFKSSIGYLV
tara:strand:+ start:55 stop:252 length:198 start_codon:yes stop_codon:yes gene_type:complete